MAKPRKPKSEDQKADNSGAVVHHQKLCLSIDMEKRRIYGFTELKVSVPESGIVGLHADSLEIERVSVDGEPAEFEYLPHYQGGENGERWSSGLSASSAADAACSSYTSALERELVPNLLILCCKSVQPPSDQQGQPNGENGLLHQPGESTQNVKLVRIDYWVEKPEAGLHFWNNVLHTDNQIRRARCWFPCMDDPSQLCCYDLEFTVAHNLVAVSCGSLLYQVLSKDDPPRKTFVYRLNVPIIAQWVSLAVAPFEILPDRHSGLLSHMCLRLNLSKLKNTVGFFHSAFNHYEDYLSASFPFGSYKQVFVGPEMMISSFNLGASMGIFSSQILFDEKVIDQTIETRIKLAYALARQWFGVYITAEASSDEWLLDGLAGFLTDSFIKRFLGNNEARYRRYKANCAVCKADVSGVTALSSSASKNLHGTQCIGLYGKIRSWKSVAILQMLEKQMGPESFRKILQIIVFRAQDTTHSLRTLSTKEFRHFANKIGNLERPFLKEFFPRWVGSCGCPVLRLGLSYNKRKNMIELAVLRGCTATQDSIASVPDGNADSETREGDVGWPGMMSIRVHELDGMYDHPILPMAGETWQLLEIQCHSKLAARRIQKPKKSSKPDGSDDNADAFPSDARSSAESPLLWLRADPEMEYLAEIHFSQPVQMWINQLEKDRDVIAQSQAITMLEALPQLSFSVVNALNNFLSDTKAFWRVRIEAAFALANTASEETDWSGLIHLVKYYKSRRFDANIGLPQPNDFHDFPEYFVLEAVPHAIAMVRAADRKSPREAVEFVLQLLKYNDNNGNPYSDVYWLAALVQSISELEFGQQSILFLSSLLKHIDRLLQFDRVMPSYNGILTISCIRTLTKIASKLSAFIPLDRVSELIKPFRNIETLWQVRIEASRALLDLEFHGNGIDASLSLFMDYLNEEASSRGQVKLAIHAMRLCQIRCRSESNDEIKIPTLTSLLCLLESRKAFNNIFLRHHLFCILQILAERPPTLHGVSRVQEQSMGAAETWIEQKNKLEALTKRRLHKVPFPIVDTQNLSPNGLSIPEASKEADTVSTGNERRMPVVKIRVKQSAASSRGEEADRSQGRQNEVDRAASSSMSVDAPRRVTNEPVGISNQNIEEVNSCHDLDSRITASIGSARPANDGDDIGKELQCTADSRKVSDLPVMEDRSSPSIVKCNDGETDAKKYISLQTLSVGSRDQNGTPEAIVDQHVHDKGKEKKKKSKKRRREEKDHKDHHNDAEYLERKRLRKEKKQREKELAKSQVAETRASSGEVQSMKEEARIESASADLRPNEPRGSKVIIKQKEKEISKLQAGEARASASEFQSSKQDPRTVPSTVGLRSNEPSGSKLVLKNVESKGEVSEGSSVQKLRIKIKNRSLNKL